MNLDNQKIQTTAKKLSNLDVNAKVNYGKDTINLKNGEGKVEITLGKNKQFIKNKTSKRGHSDATAGLIAKLEEPIKLINPQNEKTTEWYYVSFADSTVKAKHTQQTAITA